MKIRYIFLLTALLSFSMSVFAQESENKVVKKDSQYDAALAQKLGADDYGMRQFVMVVLKTGKTKIKDADERKKVFDGHFSNMSRLAEEGKLVLAGPFIEGGDKRGLFVFDVETIEEAEELVKTDPAIKAGVFEYELTKFYGSAALMQINETHKKIQKKPVN